MFESKESPQVGDPTAVGAVPAGPAELAAPAGSVDRADAEDHLYPGDPPEPEPNLTLAMAVVSRPGPVAMTLLEQVDPASLNARDRGDLLVCWERSSRWVAAQHAAAVVAVAGPEPVDNLDSERELVRAALTGCGGSARVDIELARDLAGPLRAAGRALARGEISWNHARVLCRETETLPDPVRAEITAAVVVQMLARPMLPSPAELRRAVRRAVILSDPLGAELRAEAATARREVLRWVNPDGQGVLQVTGPAAAVAMIWTAMDLRAAHPTAADDRNLDQRRFDALLKICVEATHGVDTEPQEQTADPATAPAAAPTCHADSGAAPGAPADAADTAGSSGGRLDTGAGPADVADTQDTDPHAAGTRGTDPLGPGTRGTDPDVADPEMDTADTRGTDGGDSPHGATAIGDAWAFGITGAANRLAERAGARTANAGKGGKAGRSGRRGVPGCVYLYADAATWAGLADDPVELAGYGPIPAGQARQFFATATWRAVVSDALTGATQCVSDKGYVPSARTLRFLHVQDRGCLFPGCPAAIWYCDTDHNLPHDQGGPTDTDNCGLLCRRHHLLKTFHGWTWKRLPHNGGVEWTDPAGRTWYRPAHRYLLPPARPGTHDCEPDSDPDPTADPDNDADHGTWVGQEEYAAQRERTETRWRAREERDWAVDTHPPVPLPPPKPAPYPDVPPF